MTSATATIDSPGPGATPGSPGCNADPVAFEIVSHDSHIIAVLGDKHALISTGIPATVFSDRTFKFMGQEFLTVPGFNGLNVETLSRHVGHKIDLILGMDLLSKFQWLLDWNRRRITFYRTPQDFGGAAVPVRMSMGVPIVDFNVNGQVASAMLDSASPLHYLPPDYGAGRPLREEDGFCPSYGRFRTPVYRLPIDLGGRRFEADFRVLPEWLRIGLDLVGCRWILGSDVLKRWPVAFDFKNGQIHILDDFTDTNGRDSSETCVPDAQPLVGDKQDAFANNPLAEPAEKGGN